MYPAPATLAGGGVLHFLPLASGLGQAIRLVSNLSTKGHTS